MNRQENRPPDKAPEERIRIDTSLIPDYVKEHIAAMVIRSVRAFMAQPGGREFLERVIEERRLRK